METVFISYSHKDRKWVGDWLLPRLEGAGVRVRIDFRDFEIGKPVLINIEKAVEECTRTFLVITPDWLKSQWAAFESFILQTGDPVNQKKRLIPLLLKPCDLPKRLSIFTCADFTGRDNWETQLGRLLGQMGASPTPDASYDKPQAGAVSLSRLPTTGGELFGREKETAYLDAAWADVETHIVTLVAWGGVGKTALVNGWLNDMQQQNYGGARRVFGWSFYSQGAEEGKQASADEFFRETLEWFGDPDPDAGTNVAKGRRLARLVRKQKNLLILDGLEPLQYPPGEVEGLDGKLKDDGMAAFLKELAAACTGEDNPCGLCVITTREAAVDLEHRKGYAVKEVMLEHLQEEAGTQLLTSLGVTTGSAKDFKKAVKEYEGHALALTLLGHYITNVHDGDIRKRDKIPKLTGSRPRGGHARRVMEAYERWLGESPELNILYIMGLFDRPVEKGALEALLAGAAIPGVTDRLRELSEDDRQWALSNLKKDRLLGDERTEGTLDCHPLVREHFGERLRDRDPGGWQEAHQRLYYYFKELPGKELPDTLEEMVPLFAAVAHGCKAGMHREVWEKEFEERIGRGQEAYIVNKLGAFGSTLSIFSNFFKVPWSQPEPGLRDTTKAVLLNRTAFTLRAVGRLREAGQPMKAGLEMQAGQKDWKNAASAASNLSELMLTLGEVTAAVDYGRQSVTHADRSGDEFWKMGCRTTLADALHQSGQLAEAEKLFREAEEIQKKEQPEYPFLYSLQGYQFCDLLLNTRETRAQGTYKEVMERAEKFFEWRLPSDSLLDISLDNLIAGRAWMKQAKTENSGDFSTAAAFLEQAVTGLRDANRNDHLPRALIARAECYRRRKAFSKARYDLDEAKEIALLGSMKLFICDYHLEAAKLCSHQEKENEAAEHRKKAETLIEETKYYRRRKGG
ncbi:MAG: toll/interleukin-1 receptor domain-containing protein [bacterium]|nr:toll/interleukin-1 receptor domain-containing protein [bacterium]